MNTLNHARHSSRWLVAMVALSLVIGAGSALAGSAEGSSVTVRFADLDLSTAARAETLYRRIRVAARVVCGPIGAPGLHRELVWNDCYQSAIANAVSAVNRPMLTALHRSTTTRTAAGESEVQRSSRK
jgi:UrcA family protein